MSFILDLSPQFFAEKTEEELLGLGYLPEQIPGIRKQLTEQGLTLKSESKKDTDKTHRKLRRVSKSKS